jgi:short-subunit dehydrogenase
MKKAIVIGASSGIGRSLAELLARRGYAVAIAGRRVDLLAEVQRRSPNIFQIKSIDVAHPADAMRSFEELIAEMGGMDLAIVSSGVGFPNHDLSWDPECATIAVNVAGFAAMANVAARHFATCGSGHLVGVSSIAALRGNGSAPAYNASKAFVSNYLEGLRLKFAKLNLPVTVTDVQPGFVNTAMAQGDGLFWVASPEKAAEQIFDAIKRRRAHVYVTKRWRLIAWLLKILPAFLHKKL